MGGVQGPCLDTAGDQCVLEGGEGRGGRGGTVARGAAGPPECPLGAWQGLLGRSLRCHRLHQGFLTDQLRGSRCWCQSRHMVGELPYLTLVAPAGLGVTPSHWCGQEAQRDLTPQLEVELDWKGGPVAPGLPNGLAGAPSGPKARSRPHKGDSKFARGRWACL